MSGMRTWEPDAARKAVAEALDSTSTNPWYLADRVLAALGMDGVVTVVPGRLEHGVTYNGVEMYRVVPPHPEPGQP